MSNVAHVVGSGSVIDISARVRNGVCCGLRLSCCDGWNNWEIDDLPGLEILIVDVGVGGGK